MNLSSHQYFTETELEDLDLWEGVEQFGSKKLTEHHKVAKSTLTVEDIERVQKQAYDEAFLQGKTEGYQKGFDQAQEKGFSKGFEQGKEQGIKQGQEQSEDVLRQQVATFVNLLESLNEPFQQLDESVEKALVDLAIGIANQLVRREIKIDPGEIVAVIREGVKALPIASQQLTLYMHPEDAELIRSSLALDEMTLPWNIIEDPLITRGGCKVETETSHIDMTIEKKLAIIVATVLGGEREEDDLL